MSTQGGGGDGSGILGKKRDFLESFFAKGAEFTRELLKENDSLRRRLVQIESDLARRDGGGVSDETLQELVSRLHTLEEERRRLLERFAGVDDTERRLVERYGEIEQENNDLASLYVAKSQLHSSLDVREVVQIVFEILLNFVGASEFAFYVVDDAGALRPVAAETGAGAELPTLALSGELGTWCSQGQLMVHTDSLQPRPAGSAEPLVCIPLRESDEFVGAVLVWSYFAQKEELAEVDRRIFELIHQGGGRALEAARIASLFRSGNSGGSDRFQSYQELCA